MLPKNYNRRLNFNSNLFNCNLYDSILKAIDYFVQDTEDKSYAICKHLSMHRSMESKNRNYCMHFDQWDNHFINSKNPITCGQFLAHKDFGSMQKWNLKIKLAHLKLKWCCIVKLSIGNMQQWWAIPRDLNLKQYVLLYFYCQNMIYRIVYIG